MASYIARRKFLAAFGGAAVWPLAARAQQPGVALIGLLAGAQLDDRMLSAVRQGLKEAGYVEGRNVAIKYRTADGRFSRLPGLAAELVADPVAVIVAFAPPAAVAAKAATGTIPIVFVTGADPVELGLVSSLNRPGGNVTGVTFLVTSLGAKRLELLRELVPSAKIVGFTQAAARALGIELVIRNARSESDIDSAFESLAQQRVNAVIIGTDLLFTTRRDQLVALAARHGLPTIYYLREFADAGGLISYGASITDAYRLSGGYVGRILKGEKSADLPVQQTVKFELAINASTAKALGLTVPDKLLVAADEVIE
jgi:ABC-type uncharacterized transport system substrate-binding protein